MRIRTIALVFVIGAAIAPNRAGAVSLTLGPDGPTSAQDQVSVLYASRADGSTVAIARVGDLTVDGGQIVELGVPSETSDGHVLFGANIEDRAGRLGWDIFAADPNAPAADRISHAILPLALSSGCTPRLRVDPYPVATSGGAIAFVAPRREGGDALFLYRSGHVDCLVHTGDRLHDGREIAGLSYGTVQAGADDTIVMVALLKRGSHDAAKPALWWRDHLQAVLMVSPEHGVTEVAVEGTRTPQGGVFGAFGLPAAAARDDGRETLIAFPEKNANQTSLFLYRYGRLRLVLHSGSPSAAGRVRYISQGRPSLGPDGIVAVRGASGDHDMILLASAKATRVVVRSGETLTPDVLLSSLGDPWIVSDSRIYFPAFTENRDRFFARDAAGSIRELGQPALREAAFDDQDTSRHGVSSATLFTNPRGDFTYLGGR